MVGEIRICSHNIHYIYIYTVQASMWCMRVNVCILCIYNRLYNSTYSNTLQNAGIPGNVLDPMHQISSDPVTLRGWGLFCLPSHMTP